MANTSPDCREQVFAHNCLEFTLSELPLSEDVDDSLESPQVQIVVSSHALRKGDISTLLSRWRLLLPFTVSEQGICVRNGERRRDGEARICADNTGKNVRTRRPMRAITGLLHFVFSLPDCKLL